MLTEEAASVGSQSISDRASQIVWWFISIGLFIGIWELTFAMGLYSAKFLPPPHIFLGDIPNQLQHFDFSKANPGEAPAASHLHAVAKTISATVMRVGAGLGLGFILGVLTGSLIRYFGWFGKLTLPTLTLLAPISPFAWLPVAVFLFGTGNAPAIFMVFLAVFFIIVLATIAEIDAVSKTYLQVARNLGASHLQTYTQVILPALHEAQPDIEQKADDADVQHAEHHQVRVAHRPRHRHFGGPSTCTDVAHHSIAPKPHQTTFPRWLPKPSLMIAEQAGSTLQ